MADEQYGWLDGDAAERLLRGEPLDAVDADTGAHAARVAEALAALTHTPPPGTELPGEASALAAFRAVHANGRKEGAALGRPDHPHSVAASTDVGLVRLGRPAAEGRRRFCWGRPVRLGLAAAVAAGMIGGVAVAAGAGVLPTPFDDKPGPAASVSAAATPRQPLHTPTSGAPETGGFPPPTTGATTGAPSGSGSSNDEASDGSDMTGRPDPTGDRAEDRSRSWSAAVRSSCRDMADGRQLGAERRRSLEDAAGNSRRVKAFCKEVLGGGEDRGSGTGQGQGQDNNGQNGNLQGRDGQGNSEGDQGGDQGGNGGDGESHIGQGSDSATATPSTTHPSLAPAPPRTTGLPRPTAGTPSGPEGS
ncbi:MAG: hypothetical protein LBV60_22155 [Streptomyces sp.]|jgi:hypothetical protein|nr:hypothetical protein [Streptomyces sp.]